MTETQLLEYKQSWRDEYLKWVCGFANAQGGVLEIGRSDQGEIIGLPDASRLPEELPNKTRDLLGIIADGDLMTESGKNYICITVEPYPYPISYKGAFFRAGMIEAWGQGIERIIAVCRAAGTSKPAFQYDQTGLWVVFTYKQLPPPSEKTPVKAPVKTPEQVLMQLTANPKLTLAEVADSIGRSLSAVERASTKLVKEGRLRYTGPRKGGTWEIMNK